MTFDEAFDRLIGHEGGFQTTKLIRVVKRNSALPSAWPAPTGSPATCAR